MRKSILGTEVITKEIRPEIGVEIYCDDCGVLIGRHIQGKRPTVSFDYYEVTTGHYDWGNDSCESIDEKIYCPTCLYKAFNVYISNSNHQQNTKYMRIAHTHGMNTEGMEDGD